LDADAETKKVKRADDRKIQHLRVLIVFQILRKLIFHHCCLEFGFIIYFFSRSICLYKCINFFL